VGLFDLPLEALDTFLTEHAPRRFAPVEAPPPSSGEPGRQVVLRSETALELGSPATASLSLLLWETRPDHLVKDQVLLVGPDLDEAGDQRVLPLAQIVTVSGELGGQAQTYDRYRALRQAAYGVRLEGVMLRVRPSQQRIWYRLTSAALQRGLRARELGSAVAARLTALQSVEHARVLYVTASPRPGSALERAAALTQEIVDALVKMHDDLMFDCDDCEFATICDSVDELRQMHQRLEKER
jgi:CO dehydrogenase/acetyl-CoA synthase beta subunit